MTHLTLIPQQSKVQEPPDEPSNTSAELSVTHAGRHTVSLSCSVIWRDYAIANGEPVLARLTLPDYDYDEPGNRTTMSVNLDDAEELLEAMLETVREAKRLGYAGPERSAA